MAAPREPCARPAGRPLLPKLRVGLRVLRAPFCLRGFLGAGPAWAHARARRCPPEEGRDGPLATGVSLATASPRPCRAQMRPPVGTTEHGVRLCPTRLGSGCGPAALPAGCGRAPKGCWAPCSRPGPRGSGRLRLLPPRPGEPRTPGGERPTLGGNRPGLPVPQEPGCDTGGFLGVDGLRASRASCPLAKLTRSSKASPHSVSHSQPGP